MMRRRFRGVLAGALLLGLVPVLALAQTPSRLGMVTTLTGEATVTRPASREPVSLQYKDSLSAGDRLRTAERSILRVFLGGSSALLTMGQLSLATVGREGDAIVVEFEAGKIYVGVVPPAGAARPTLTTEIRTPNAVVILRGTSVVTELTRVGDPRGRPTIQTTLSVLTGTVEVLPRRAGSRVMQKVGANTAVTVVGNVVGPLRPFDTKAAAALMAGLRPEEPQHTDTGESIVEGVAKKGREDAAADAAAARREGAKKVPGMAKPPIVPPGVPPPQVTPPPRSGSATCC
jgi:hypothetical protein